MFQLVHICWKMHSHESEKYAELLHQAAAFIRHIQIPSFNASVSGVNTSNEDMADEGGAAVALKVVFEDYSIITHIN